MRKKKVESYSSESSLIIHRTKKKGDPANHHWSSKSLFEELLCRALNEDFIVAKGKSDFENWNWGVVERKKKRERGDKRTVQWKARGVPLFDNLLNNGQGWGRQSPGSSS